MINKLTSILIIITAFQAMKDNLGTDFLQKHIQNLPKDHLQTKFLQKNIQEDLQTKFLEKNIQENLNTQFLQKNIQENLNTQFLQKNVQGNLNTQFLQKQKNENEEFLQNLRLLYNLYIEFLDSKNTRFYSFFKFSKYFLKIKTIFILITEIINSNTSTMTDLENFEKIISNFKLFLEKSFIKKYKNLSNFDFYFFYENNLFMNFFQILQTYYLYLNNYCIQNSQSYFLICQKKLPFILKDLISTFDNTNIYVEYNYEKIENNEFVLELNSFGDSIDTFMVDEGNDDPFKTVIKIEKNNFILNLNNIKNEIEENNTNCQNSGFFAIFTEINKFLEITIEEEFEYDEFLMSFEKIIISLKTILTDFSQEEKKDNLNIKIKNTYKKENYEILLNHILDFEKIIHSSQNETQKKYMHILLLFKNFIDNNLHNDVDGNLFEIVINKIPLIEVDYKNILKPLVEKLHRKIEYSQIYLLNVKLYNFFCEPDLKMNYDNLKKLEKFYFVLEKLFENSNDLNKIYNGVNYFYYEYSENGINNIKISIDEMILLFTDLAKQNILDVFRELKNVIDNLYFDYATFNEIYKQIDIPEEKPVVVEEKPVFVETPKKNIIEKKTIIENPVQNSQIIKNPEIQIKTPITIPNKKITISNPEINLPKIKHPEIQNNTKNVFKSRFTPEEKIKNQQDYLEMLGNFQNLDIEDFDEFLDENNFPENKKKIFDIKIDNSFDNLESILDNDKGFNNNDIILDNKYKPIVNKTPEVIDSKINIIGKRKFDNEIENDFLHGNHKNGFVFEDDLNDITTDLNNTQIAADFSRIRKNKNTGGSLLDETKSKIFKDNNIKKNDFFDETVNTTFQKGPNGGYISDDSLILNETINTQNGKKRQKKIDIKKVDESINRTKGNIYKNGFNNEKPMDTTISTVQDKKLKKNFYEDKSFDDFNNTIGHFYKADFNNDIKLNETIDTQRNINKKNFISTNQTFDSKLDKTSQPIYRTNFGKLFNKKTYNDLNETTSTIVQSKKNNQKFYNFNKFNKKDLNQTVSTIQNNKKTNYKNSDLNQTVSTIYNKGKNYNKIYNHPDLDLNQTVTTTIYNDYRGDKRKPIDSPHLNETISTIYNGNKVDNKKYKPDLNQTTSTIYNNSKGEKRKYNVNLNETMETDNNKKIDTKIYNKPDLNKTTSTIYNNYKGDKRKYNHDDLDESFETINKKFDNRIGKKKIIRNIVIVEMVNCGNCLNDFFIRMKFIGY